jgi:hypothetical protein
MRFILSILLCTLAVNSFAQNFSGGVILGISTTQVGGDNLGGFNKAGLLTGVFVNKSISSLLSLQMEMTYIQKGSNNPNMNNSEHSNYLKEDISSSYTEIPLLIHYQQSEVIKIEGGILTGILIDAYYKDNLGKINYGNTPPFIKYDFGLLLGINYKYSEKISLNTRLSNSILAIGTEDYTATQSYNSSRKGKYNSVLSFAIHYNL